MERMLYESHDVKEESHTNFAKLITFVDDFRKTFTKSNIIQRVEEEGNLQSLMNESIRNGLEKYERVFGQSKVL